MAASSVEAADNIGETEAVAADYRDREGYVANFLGKKFKVDLPAVTRDAGDVLDFEFDGETRDRAALRALLGGDEPQPADVLLQRLQHRRQPVDARARVSPGNGIRASRNRSRS